MGKGNVLHELGLTNDQTKVLFSMQYLLTRADIYGEKSGEKKVEKRNWLKQWSASCEVFLKKQTKDYHLLTTLKSLNSGIEKISKDLANRTPLYLILMETTFFKPYFKLTVEKDDPYKKLKITSKAAVDKVLEDFAKDLRIDIEYIERFKVSLAKSKKGITGYWKKILIGGTVGTILMAVTAGFAAPLIGGLFAGPGLFGAAATSAGLAVLGGGAIAAGGMGMAGGIAVIVGGGALLGLGAGGGIGVLFSVSSEYTLSEAAKFEVVMKEIVIHAQGDIRLAQELIKGQRDSTKQLEEELFQLKEDQVENKKKIKILAKSVQYLRSAIERNEENILNAA
jgi:hypothetical protein